MTLPLTLQLTGKRVVVVGGGHVATRRSQSFVAAEASVVVIAPKVSDELRQAAATGVIEWLERPYRDGDLAGAWLVQAATDSAEVNDAVAAEAESRQTFCLKGGDPEHATAWTPAVASFDDVSIAISGGGDARRAATLRDSVAQALHTGDLAIPKRRESPGRVILLGAGPGDLDLMTLAGRRLLNEADVLVTDRLAPNVIKELPTDSLEIIDVGKRPGHHPVPQHRINEILVEHASRGRTVVRLKGGDPFVFGRGGEEFLHCRAAGIAVEIVPGISSAIAVAARASIPLTHRGVSTGFTVITGHSELGDVPIRTDHTIVILMGVARLAESVAELLSAGLAPQTPVAMIERGWTDRERLTTARLDHIVKRAAYRCVTSPAVIVIGNVVTALDDRLGDERDCAFASR